MTDRQQAFVAHYLVTLNAAEAARKAGYSPRRADQIDYENLRKPEIAAAIRLGTARLLQAAGLSAERTLEELRRIAFSDLTGCFDASGNLLPLSEMRPEARAAVASVTVVRRNLASDDGCVDEVHQVRFWDKLRGLETLAKHFGLLVERIKHTGSVNLVHRLQAARQRGKPGLSWPRRHRLRSSAI